MRNNIGQEDNIIETLERLKKLKNRLEAESLVNDVVVLTDVENVLKHLIETGPYGTTIKDIE